MARGACEAGGGSLPAPKCCREQRAEAGGFQGRGFEGLHYPRGAQSSSRWGFANLPSSGTLGTISLHGLRAEAPLGPQGASPPGLQDFGVAGQFPTGGKGLRAELGTAWLEVAEDGETSTSLEVQVGWLS